MLLERLPNVSYRYDAARQTIDFTAANDARVVRVIDMRPKDRADLQPATKRAWLTAAATMLEPFGY